MENNLRYKMKTDLILALLVYNHESKYKIIFYWKKYFSHVSFAQREKWQKVYQQKIESCDPPTFLLQGKKK